MRCPVCGFANAAGAPICAACGSALAVAAPPAGALQAPRCAVHPEVDALTTCSRCGTFACAVCLAGVPPLCAACRALAGTLPWDQRAELGTLKAWWQTSTRLMGSPEKTLATTSPSGSIGSSLLFAMLSTVAGYGTSMVLYGVFAVFSAAFAKDAVSDLSDAPARAAGGSAALVVGVVMMIGLVFAFQVVSVLGLAAFEHVALKLLGAQPGDFAVTVRCQALGMAPYVVGLMPFCGAYVFPIWAMVVQGIAVKHLHRTTAGKAAIAVVSPVVLVCGVCGLGYVILLAGMGGLMADLGK